MLSVILMSSMVLLAKAVSLKEFHFERMCLAVGGQAVSDGSVLVFLFFFGSARSLIVFDPACLCLLIGAKILTMAISGIH